MMFASFHSKGTIPSFSDMLKTCASGVLTCSTVSFSISGGIPYTHGALQFIGPFLNKGMLFASVHSKCTIPSFSDMLKTCASGVLTCSTVSFSILGDIPSTHGALQFIGPFLNKGMLFASVHSKGTIPSFSDMLNTCASDLTRF